MAKTFEQIIPHFVGGISQQPSYIRHPSTSQDEVNTWPSFSQGLRKRPPTYHQAKLMHKTGKNVSAQIVTLARQLFLVIIEEGKLSVWDKEGNACTVTYLDGGEHYLKGKTFYCLPHHTCAYILNKNVNVKMSDKKAETLGSEALVFCKQFVPETEYKIELLSKEGDLLKTFTYKHHKDQKDINDSVQIMKKLFDQGGENPTGFIKSRLQGSKILFTSEGADFRIRVTDGQGDALLGLVKGSVNKVSDLPATGFDGFTVEVTTGGDDSYYLAFSDITGTWKETVKPGLANHLDAQTMPHLLTLKEDGTFTFEPESWESRKAGNEDTSPEPSFVGLPLQDIFFYLGRLGVLVTDSVVFSEVDAWKNFFPTTANTVVDSDPIDVTVASGDVTSGFPNLLYGLEVPKGDLLLFGRHVQYVLSADKALTPQNIKVSLHSHVNCGSVRPVSLEQSVVFISPALEYSHVKEFIPNRSDVNYLLAETLTEHVPALLPKGIKKLVTVNAQKLLLVLPYGENREGSFIVYAYFYYWHNDKRLQSAWVKWDFASRVLDICTTGQEVWFIFAHGDGVFFEKMTFAPNALCLDHQEGLKSGAYDEESKTTTWTTNNSREFTQPLLFNRNSREKIALMGYS